MLVCIRHRGERSSARGVGLLAVLLGLSLVGLLFFGLLTNGRVGLGSGTLLSPVCSAPVEIAPAFSPALDSRVTARVPSNRGDARGRQGVAVPSPDVECSDDRSATELELRLVTDADVPLSDATVFVRRGETLVAERIADEHGVVVLDDSAFWEHADWLVVRDGCLIGNGAWDGTTDAQTIIVTADAVLSGLVTVDGLPAVGLELMLQTPGHGPVLSVGADLLEVTPGPFRTLFATTDEDGRFRFEGLDHDWSGFIGVPFGHRTSANRSRVTVDGPQADLRVELVEGFSIRGRAVTPSGQPAAGAGVGVELVYWDAAERRESAWTSAFDEVCDASGAFKVFVTADEYVSCHLTIAQAGSGRLERTWEVDSSGSSIDLGVLVLERSVAWSVVARTADGTPLQGAVARVSGFASEPSGEDGICRLSVVPGDRATVTALGFDEIALLASDDQEGPVTVRLKRVPTLVIQTSARISVRLSAEGALPSMDAAAYERQVALGAAPVRTSVASSDDGLVLSTTADFEATGDVWVPGLPAGTPVGVTVRDALTNELLWNGSIVLEPGEIRELSVSSCLSTPNPR